MEREYAEAALKHAMPSMHEMSYGTAFGGLISYGPDIGEVFRRAGRYVRRILKGAKPADMPLELPREFRLLVNLKTAKSLGVTIPAISALAGGRVSLMPAPSLT